jgi:beta-lactam-binding protein with PASTA domain/tRNA A-37 threonylcarbamoyl transferase component Bud32
LADDEGKKDNPGQPEGDAGNAGDTGQTHLIRPYTGNGGNGGAPGRVLNGRYALITPVGGGGMATVYKARDNVLGRIVAVKVLREQYTLDEQFVARFRREAQAAANLTHPNIVNVYDVGQDGDLHFIVMEYIAGHSLKDRITRQSPLPLDLAVDIAAQILAGLEYAHRSGLIHRDIKPQNVLLTNEGVVKVTDFGIAKSVSDLGLTEAGIALGTAHYFSPEQARGERVVPQSDIYAVGVTLFEMIAGRLPFESESAVGLAYKHIGEPPPNPRVFNPGIPPRLEAIVLRALAKDPGQRFTSAADMERALRSIEFGGQQPTMEVPVPPVRPNVTGQGRPTTRTGRAGSAQPITGSLSGAGGPPRGAYAAAAGAPAGAVTRQVTSALGAPSSAAIRPAPVRVQSGSGGCSVAAVIFLVLGIAAALVGGGLALGGQIPFANFFNEVIVPSPTITPIIPTSTPTNTPVPPTATSTSTPTATPTATNTPISVAVPRLVGLSIQDATTLTKQRGFVLVELERIDSPEWGQGIVAQQDPAPDTIFQQTRTISVRVSNGPPPFALPNLANTNPNDAKAALETAGLRVALAYEGSTTVPEGVVIRTVPVADASVRPGDDVTIYVSLGETSTVPNLTGVQDADLARQLIEAAGLMLGSVVEVDDPAESVPPGAVLSQNPGPGTIAKKGSLVDITIRRRQ